MACDENVQTPVNKIAKLLGRNKSTISRELARNGDNYLPNKAQARYRNCRKKCRPNKLLPASSLKTPEQKRSTGNRGAIRRLRHRGKPRRKKGYVSNRGKIPITNELSAHPVEANERSRFGDCEADTIIGYKTAMIEALRGQPVHTITPDRGREFQLHGEVTAVGCRVLFSAAASTVAPRHQREYQRLVARIFERK